MTSSDILPTLKSFSDYLYPFKIAPKSQAQKRFKHNTLRELYKTRPTKPHDPEISLKMTEWLLKLDKKSLNQVLTHKNMFISTFAHEAYNFVSNEQNFFFRLKSVQPMLEMQKSVFYWVESEKKVINDFELMLNEVDKRFEAILRFCDLDGYCDCLSVDPGVESGEFLAFAKRLTGNRAFEGPCRVSWEAHTNTWIWDYPAWFVPGQYYTLACFVLSSLERSAWMHFWTVHNLDPRSGCESQLYKMQTLSNSTQISELTQFLNSLSTQKAKEIIGDKQKHLEICQKAVSYIESIQNNSIELKKIDCDNGSIVLILPNKIIGNKNVEIISQKFEIMNKKEFVEFLYFTPFERISTAVDLVAKKLLINIASAMSDKKAEDLMREPIKLQKKLVKKQKKPKIAKEKNKDFDVFKVMAKDILNNIISELEENPEFQVKKPQNNRSGFLFKPNSDHFKPKLEEIKAQQPEPYFKPSHNKTYNRKQNKRPHSSKTKVLNSNQSTPKMQTAKTSTEVTPTKPENTQKFKWSKITPPVSSNLDTFDFPPLINEEPVKFSNFHEEIKKFCNNVSKKVTQKFEKFRPSLENIYLIISEQHPNCTIFIFGSYGSTLAIESSDIDLLVTLPNLPNRREIKSFCLALADNLQGLFRSATAITSARIPLVKLETDEYCIDISFEDDEESHLGLPTMNLVIQSTLTYPGLREMMLLFKQVLQLNGLNCSFRGGLGAYGLFIWVLAYFRSCSKQELDLGVLAEGFLKYFAGFDAENCGLDLREVNIQFGLESKCFENVVTIDPITGNNVTAGLFQSKEIFGLFRECLGRIEQCKEKLSCRGMLRTIFKFT